MAVSLDLIASLASFSLLFYLYSRSKRRSRLPLPPGPKKLPLIGNLLDMPKGFEWVTYQRWAQQYQSDIIHLNAAGISLIILDSAEAANDLFEKRSSNYSSRYQLPMINELLGWNIIFVFMPYGEYWREHRRLFHQEFHPTATLRYRPQEVKGTHQLLRRLLNTPDDWMSHLRHMAGAISLAIAYGMDIQPSDDPYIELAEKAHEGLMQAALPGSFLVDTLPFSCGCTFIYLGAITVKHVPEWFPGAGFKRKAKEWRSYTMDMAETPFQATKQNIANGIAAPSFTLYCLDTMDPKQDIAYQERIVMETAAAIYSGGSHTTVSALGIFVLAIITHPEVQIKAQKELDEILGGTRLPDFTDEPSLPYITAIVMEVLRWENVTPLGVPHVLSVDDEYKGYHLPAGSIIFANVWSILHNETTYPDPFSFKPERFIMDGKINRAIKDPGTAAFGFGRRICPGRYMAYSSVWIVVASLLASFNITKPIDSDGLVIEPSGEYTGRSLNSLVPFKCSFKPRSVEAEELITSTDFPNK